MEVGGKVGRVEEVHYGKDNIVDVAKPRGFVTKKQVFGMIKIVAFVPKLIIRTCEHGVGPRPNEWQFGFFETRSREQP